jgi:L-threonylcarbamoyladenylate synthase
MIVDGGPANVGIESTVVSLAGEVPVLLRPGMISPERIGSLIGRLEAAPSVSEGAHPSPGMHQRHYSPATKLVLVAAGALPREGRGAYLWHDRQARGAELSVPMPPDPTAYAAMLYGTLHDLDSQGFDWIAVECPPTDSDWAGILDRLKRASADAQ